MSLKFYTSVTKEIKITSKSFRDVKVPTFIEVTGVKLVGGRGVGWVQRCLLPILNRIKAIISIFRVLTYLLNYPYIHLSSLSCVKLCIYLLICIFLQLFTISCAFRQVLLTPSITYLHWAIFVLQI